MNSNWYNKSANSVASEIGVDVSRGLSSEEVEEKLEEHGYNELKEKEKESLLSKIITQLKDFLVIILIVASVVSALVGEVTDSIVIIAIVIINAVLGVLQEGKAEKALDALRKMSSPNAKVFRNSHMEIIPAKMLVPGDVILLEAGDIIPADIRLIESANLKIEEASLTGESVPVEKKAERSFDTEIGIGDRLNMAYMSTIVSYGRGRGIVVETGNGTEIGKIADAIQTIKEEATPLQRKLDEMSKWLGIICLGVCGIVFVVGLLRGGDVLEMFMVSVSLAVAAIPEGLPAVVTIVLALGMKRMIDRNAIVRKLLAVETLGCIDVICSDKTGTLTQNEMTVVGLYAADKKAKVTGQGYNPKGDFKLNDDERINPNEDSDFKMLLSVGVLCNDSILEKKDKEENLWGIIGDPTEAALIVVGAKANMEKADMNSKYPRIDEIPFDSDRKMMTTFHENFIVGKVVSFTKGAPDIILGKCTKAYINGKIVDLSDDSRNTILKVNSGFASSALRVLSFAYREYDKLPEAINSEKVEGNMIFIGLMGMIDPARVEAAEAIKVCKQAGIKPVMITGDYKDTAIAIAKQLGLMSEKDGVLTGSELDHIDDEELKQKVETTSVYARVSPDHKVRIIDALKKNGHIASMTGDGVNDAMALKRADIGVSMGITGTDVAKGTADIVLTDDNFASIVSAVEEGRIIYSNIRKFVAFLLSCNVGEILIVFISILVGLPVPLLPIQLLWVNLATDSLPALALGTEKGDKDIMSLKPRSPKEPILNKRTLITIVIQSIAMTAVVLAVYIFALKSNNKSIETARTYAFATLICAQLFQAYSSRSQRNTIFKLGIFTNKSLGWATLISFVMLLGVIYLPVLQPIFKTVVLNANEWMMIIFMSIIPLIIGETYKIIARKFAT